MKKRLITTFLILLTSTLSLFAQPDAPCGGAEPDSTECPIDSWVFILMAAALVITTLHLHNKKNALMG